MARHGNPLAALMGEAEGGETFNGNLRKRVQELRQAAERFNEPHIFKSGDLVRWKEGMKDARWPMYCEPAIVMAIIDPPLTFQDAPNAEVTLSSPFFWAKNDLRLGFLSEDGTFLECAADSRRMEPFVEPNT